MDATDNRVYIIDVFSRFSPDDVVQTFRINGNWYCIKHVPLDWGLPVLKSIDEEADPKQFHIYNTLEEAREYVHQIKALEGAHF